jgi:hypothetical protein
MSLDYGAGIAVGYRFTVEEALKPFEVVVGEDRFEEQERFDPKSGKKIAPERVQVEFAYTKHVWKGIQTTCDEEDDNDDIVEDDYIGREDFLEKVAEANGFQVVTYGYSENEEEYFAVFMPKHHPEEIPGGCDNGRFTAGGNLPWAQVAEMGKELMELRKKLVKLGLKPGQPEVALTWSIS